jgi:integrase-like protein
MSGMSPNVDENNEIESARVAQLTGFMEWLRDRNLASTKRIPHYARWVQNFLRYRGMRPREAWQDSLQAFVTELEADPRKLDWHIQQAGEAVSLYFAQFRVGDATRVSREGDRRIVGHAETIAEMERLMQLRHYAPRTQSSYGGWAKRFLTYVDPQGVRLPTADDVSAFLSHLATARQVAASTQNQALHALLFLCRSVLDIDLSAIVDTLRARRGPKLPVGESMASRRSAVRECGQGDRRQVQARTANSHGRRLHLGGSLPSSPQLDWPSGCGCLRRQHHGIIRGGHNKAVWIWGAG